MPNIIYLCPATPKGKCSWEGHAEEVVTHFEDFHKQQYLIDNVIHFDVTQQHETNYLMNLFGATYLVQAKFAPANEGDKLFVKLRYLGSAEKACSIRYTLELKVGDMAFTSKHGKHEFHPVTIENDGSIEVDLQTIRVMTNKRLTSIVAFIHIENKLLDYAYRSFRRRPNVRHKGGSLRVNSKKKTVQRSSSDIGEYLRSVRKTIEEVEVNGGRRIGSDILEESELDKGVSSDDEYSHFIEAEKISVGIDNETVKEIVMDILNESILNALNEVSKRELKQNGIKAPAQQGSCRKLTGTEGVEDISGEYIERVCANSDTSKDFQEDFKTKPMETSKQVKDVVEYKSREEILNSNFFDIKKTCEESHTNDETLSKSSARREYVLSIKTFDVSDRKTWESTVSNRSRLSHLESEWSEDEHSDDEQCYEETESVFQDEVITVKTSDINQTNNGASKIENVNPNHEIANTRRDGEDKGNMNMYWTQLNKIKCSNCCLYMTPPIHICTNGHSVCSWCKISLCSVCRSDITDIRNLDLEHLSWSITHPCRFAAKGCAEFHTWDKIREHETRCDFFTYVCPKCRINLKFSDLVKHLKVVHPSLKVTSVIAHPIGRDVEFLMVNILGVFYCCSSVRSSSIEWSVKFCGLESVPFACAVKIKGKKEVKVFPLYRNQDGFNRVMFLNELKAAKVKEKNAVLHITAS